MNEWSYTDIRGLKLKDMIKRITNNPCRIKITAKIASIDTFICISLTLLTVHSASF